jgi:hypothetical protein
LLFWLRPEIANIDCDRCFQYVYDLDKGEPVMWRGKPASRKGVPPPCKKKCPKRGPDEFSTLLPINQECLQHYMECTATGNFPDDPLVKRHAAILRNIEREVEKLRRREDLNLVAMQQHVAQLSQWSDLAKNKG